MNSLLDNRYNNINIFQRGFFWTLYKFKSALNKVKKSFKQFFC